MSAPLYSRYTRYAEREANRFPRKSIIGRMIPTWKRPSTTVFALSERAAHEAGWWSSEPPGELLRGLSLQYMPTERVWIEWDWRQMIAGSQRAEFGQDTEIVMRGRGGLSFQDENSPIRVGAMIRQTCPREEVGEKADRWFDKDLPEGTFMAMLFYLYRNGTCFVGPTFSYWHGSESMVPMSHLATEGNAEKAGYLHLGAVGNHYALTYKEQNPRLTQKLTNQMFILLIGRKGVGQHGELDEVQGTTRLIQAALMAALSAKPTQYDADPNLPPRERKKRGGKGRRVHEVDLFIRERRKPGASLKSSVGHMEGVKKGLHTVGAHYAYRRRDDGADPRVCTVEPSGIHDFEEVHGTKSEVCVLCGQRRWFKDAHERGDEAYGIVPRRVRNVRLGEMT
jgi:hypothetical protein